VIESFSAPGNDPEGLAWDGQYIWHVDSGSAYDLGCEEAKPYIYKIDPQSGDATRMFEAPGPGCNAEDLAWDGDYLWYVDGATEAEAEGTTSIYRIDPASGAVVTSFDAPGPHPSGIAWDGSHLWLSDYWVAKIYKIDPGDGKVIETISAPSSNPGGLAWDGRYLWCADWKSGTIYRMDVGVLP
jgi:sugar lactone lactonase YvrE